MAFFNRIPPQAAAMPTAANLPPALLQAMQMRARMQSPGLAAPGQGPGNIPPGLPPGMTPMIPPPGPGSSPMMPQGMAPAGMPPPGAPPGMPPGMGLPPQPPQTPGAPPPGAGGPPGMMGGGPPGAGGTPGLDILKLMMAMKNKGGGPMSGGVGSAPPPSLNMPFSLSANGSNSGIYDLISKIISSTGTGTPGR